jgi:hypothetical protein
VEKLQNLLRELFDTEKSYVRRLDILQNVCALCDKLARSVKSKLCSSFQSYAKPLKAYARRKETAIISIFEANSIFGNVERLHALNAQFLADWEKATTMKRQDWGRVIMEHVRHASDQT